MITADCETRSFADLKKVGGWNYSRHITTDVLCWCYAIEDGPIQRWWPDIDGIKRSEFTGDQAWPDIEHPAMEWMPYDLCYSIEDGMPFEAHNVSFERSIMLNLMASDYQWVLPADKQWRDTMAVAAYYALPLDLEKVSRVLGFQGKDPEGGRLISRYSKLHLKTAKEVIPEEDHTKFVNYCAGDVDQERKVSDYLGDLPDDEQEVFFLDQAVNLRGIYLNEKSIKDAEAIANQRAAELKLAFQKLSGGLSPSQHDKVKLWLHSLGCEVENLQAKYIEDLLDGEDKKLDPPTGVAREALELRRKFNKASTKKLSAMLNFRESGNRGDGRARFQTRYHGAATGRWTGTGFQPLNMNKGFEDVPPRQLITDISHRDPKWLDIMYGDAMDAVGKATRHHIVAAEGHRIMAGDYTSIEAVVLACLAGEEWKIEAFKNKDPIYELMGCEIHRLGPEAVALAKMNKGAFKDKYPAERFDGKTGELAFGYQGGVGAWRKFDSSDKHTDERVNEIKTAWREKHEAVTRFWRDLENAAISCVMRDKETHVGPLSFKLFEHWLSIRLPDGKRIWYWDPQLRQQMPPWHKPDPEGEDPKYEDCRQGTCDCKPRVVLTYMALKEGQWRRVSTYGGKIAENVCQAVSRQILVPAMLRLTEVGYPIILSVYDEVVAEVPLGFGSLGEFTEIMEEKDEWYADWPVRAEVWEGMEYKK